MKFTKTAVLHARFSSFPEISENLVPLVTVNSWKFKPGFPSNGKGPIILFLVVLEPRDLHHSVHLEFFAPLYT